MGAHGSIASERASRVAVAGIWKRVIFDLIVPRLYQLKNGPVAVNRRWTRSVNYTWHNWWWATNTDIPTLTLSNLREKDEAVLVQFGSRCVWGLMNTETFKTWIGVLILKPIKIVLMGLGTVGSHLEDPGLKSTPVPNICMLWFPLAVTEICCIASNLCIVLVWLDFFYIYSFTNGVSGAITDHNSNETAWGFETQ